MYSVTKKFRFEMSHILSDYDGLCGNLHGHSYCCYITFSSKSLEDGMVYDFADLKELCNELIIDKLDHCFAVNYLTDDPFEKEIWEVVKKHNKKVFEFPFRTTAENMSTYIRNQINAYLFENSYNHIVSCTKVVLYETETGCAISEDQVFIC